MPELPNEFVTTTPTIASFNFFDAARGLAFIEFYGCASGSSVYFLTTNSNIDAPQNKYYTDCPSDSTTTITFDYTFTKGLIVAGAPAYVNASHVDKTESAPDVQVEAEFYHYDGSTETLIGEATTAEQTNCNYGRHLILAALTKTQFYTGDILRLKLNVSVSDHSVRIYHDPKSNETFTESAGSRTIGSDLLVTVPFVIEN